MSVRRWLVGLAVALWVAAGGLALAPVHADGVPFGIGQGQQGAAASAETTPVTIFGSKLVSWYRADLEVTGDPATAWGDSGPNGHDLTASGTPDPTTDSGTACIDFESGDSDYFYRTLSGEPTNEPVVVYAVVDMESSANADIFSINLAGGTTHRWVCRMTSLAARAQSFDGTSNSAATHGTTLSTGVRYMLYYDFTADNARSVNVDELTPVSNTSSRTVTGVDRVGVGSGRGDAAATTWDGRVFEVVLLNATPSAGEESSYESYADARFTIPGITSVPPPTGPRLPPLPPILFGSGAACLLLALRRQRARRGEVLAFPAREAARQAA